jgi:uncharacterized membrane protein HdeD (DUF308 family)
MTLWIHDSLFFRKYPVAIKSKLNEKESDMFTQLFRNWWMFAVRGVLAIAFGILALIWPESTKVVLVWLFGAFTLLDGIFAVAAGVATHGFFDRWWALLLEGIAGIVVGLTAFFWTDLTALVLLI